MNIKGENGSVRMRRREMEYRGRIFVVVYVGAIAVLFRFRRFDLEGSYRYPWAVSRGEVSSNDCASRRGQTTEKREKREKRREGKRNDKKKRRIWSGEKI